MADESIDVNRSVIVDVEAALASVYEEHVRAVYGFLRTRCGSSPLAEDPTATTFEHAARLFARGRGGEVDRSWLFTVARRRLIDQWRSSTREGHTIMRFKNELSTRSMSQDRELDASLSGALDALSTRQRAAVMLRYLDDFSVSEVAQAIGCSCSATESLLARGRRSLLTALEMMDDG